jgi:hypothetical protein
MNEDMMPEIRDNKRRGWRSIASLAAGILLFVALATLMIWVGSLVTAAR